jgi:hypothetical protein
MGRALRGVWLADADVGAARVRPGARRGRDGGRVAWAGAAGLAEPVPVDVLRWDRVELATGAVRHEAIPAAAESRGVFEAAGGNAAGHPLLSAHASRRRPALRLSEAVEPRRLHHNELYADLLHPSGVEYGITVVVRTERREMVVAGLGRAEREFSERDRDVLDLVRPALDDALRDAEARERLVSALATNPPPRAAVVLVDRYGEIELSIPDDECWLAEQFGAAEHSGRLPRPVARLR